MNIILIKPYYPYPYGRGEDTYNRIWPPLCLANCAALLEKDGHNVKILDAHAQRIKPHNTARHIKGRHKVFITSSELDKWQCPNTDITYFLETIRYAKRSDNEIYVMGYHGTAEPEKFSALPEIKAVIRGEPENTVREICRGNSLRDIKGVSFNENGTMISNSQAEPLNLKEFPPPAYHLLNFSRYFYEILGGSFALFEITRGCGFKCAFCSKIMYGEGVRTKTKEQIIAEVAAAIEKYHVKTGYFIDLDFLAGREAAGHLCDYLIKRKYKFRWTCQTRPDSLDMDAVTKMKAAGCQIIHMGIETGRQELLDYLNKRISLDNARKAVELCKKTGIKTLAFFIFGVPGESARDREIIFKFIKELNTDFVSFHRIFPYKGSAIRQEHCVADPAVDRFIRKSLFRYYARPASLLRINPLFVLSGLRLFFSRITTLR